MIWMRFQALFMCRRNISLSCNVNQDEKFLERYDDARVTRSEPLELLEQHIVESLFISIVKADKPRAFVEI